MEQGKYTLDNTEKLVSIAKALSSEIKIDILKLLCKESLSINDIAKKMNIPSSSAALNIKMLEEAGFVKTQLIKGSRGSAKLCTLTAGEISILFETDSSDYEDMDIIDMPIGSYVDYRVVPTCGIVDKKGYIDEKDEPRCFYSPLRTSAKLIWFGDGYLEYRFPNNLIQDRDVKSLEISAELCSEAKDYNLDYPSDITLWINGIEAGTFFCQSDYGGRRGKLNPSWWPDKNTQYGELKVWSVTDKGTFLDGKETSQRGLMEYNLRNNEFISVRIGVKEDALHRGGVNIFGDEFGDYSQNLIMKFIYK